MTPVRLARLVRHPIKSVGYQEIERAALTQGRPLPFDRLWAVATEAAGFDADRIDWQPKMRFVRGAAEGTLQAVRADFDAASGAITLSHPICDDFHGRLPDDGDALVAWLRPLWPANRPHPARLVSRADGGALTDVPEPFLAILSTTSHRILGKRMGLDLSIHRWRGNLWLDGLAPWEEFNLIGKEVQIGTARLRVEERITRCAATTFDPLTGRAGGDTLAALEHGWGHRDFGVYARVTVPGDISVDDEVTILP
ncbi:MAG: MOSC domain-containing protein [Rhodobacteraceae bacterium]|jgi:hypothetical protein|nr:MOSC domain-containing protein [Paracoccaceae bacterium]